MKRVAVLPWPDIDGAYLCVSGKLRHQEHFGDRWYAQHTEHTQTYEETLCTDPYITFLFDAGDVCTEWDGESGPLQRWYKCGKDHDEAREHWLYDYAYGLGHWSQMAVNDEDLPRKFNTGDYTGIFASLQRWAT